MDPFYVVRLAGDAPDQCAARSSKTSAGTAAAKTTRSSRPAGPRTPGADRLTDNQRARLTALLTADGHTVVEAIWGIYQPADDPAPTATATAHMDDGGDRRLGAYVVATLTLLSDAYVAAGEPRPPSACTPRRRRSSRRAMHRWPAGCVSGLVGAFHRCTRSSCSRTTPAHRPAGPGHNPCWNTQAYSQPLGNGSLRVAVTGGDGWLGGRGCARTPDE